MGVDEISGQIIPSLNKDVIFTMAKVKGSPRRYIKTLVENKVDEISQDSRKKGNRIPRTTIKEAKKKILLSLMEDYKKLGEMEYPVEIEDLPDKEKEEERETAINNILSKVFYGITIKGKKITMMELSRTFSTSDVEVSSKGAFGRNQNPLKSSDKIRKKLEERNLNAFETDDLKEMFSNIETVLDGIDEWYSESSGGGSFETKVRTAGDEKNTVIDVRDNILQLMGNQRYAKTNTRKAIYASWKKVHEQHKTVVTKVNSLVVSLKKQDIDTNELEDKIKEFSKEENNYVQEFDTARVDKATRYADTVLAFSQGYIEEEFGFSVNNDGEVFITDGVEEGSKIKEEQQEYSGELPIVIDPLGYSYISSYVYGIFLNPEDIPMVKKYSIKFMSEMGFEDMEDKRRFEDALALFTDVNPIIEGLFLPVQIVNNKGIKLAYPTTKEGNRINPSTVEATIVDLLTALEDVLFDQKSSKGGNIDVTGLQYSKDKKADKYRTAYGKKPAIPAKLGSKTEVAEVMKALDEYIYNPLINPVMTMDLDFPMTRKSAYKSIQVLGTGDYAKAYRKLIQTAQKKTVKLFSNKDLVAIKKFLEILNKPNIKMSEVREQGLKIRPAINRAFGRDREIIKDFDNDMAEFLYAISLKTREAVGSIRFKGATIAATDKDSYTQKNLDVQSTNRVTVLSLLKQFFQDPSNASLLTKRGSTTVKQILSLLNQLRKSEIENKILETHDSLRILKGMPTYFGLGSLSSFDNVSEILKTSKKNFNVDLTNTDVVKIVEEVDSFSNIAKSVGVSEEIVYYVKANFR